MSAAVAELISSAMRPCPSNTPAGGCGWSGSEGLPLRDQPWQGEHSYGENATSATVCWHFAVSREF